MSENTIYIVDVTNRDGVQTAHLGLAKLEKTLINLYLNQMGVYQSEFGFPTTRHETNYINANLELAEMAVLTPMVLEGWVRAIPEDVSLAFDMTNVQHLNLSISTSEQMTQGKFQGRRDRDDVLDMMAAAVDKAKELGAKTIGVNAEDASRTDMAYLIRFSKVAKEHGADRVRYCDTLGYDDPFSIYDRIKELATEVEMPIEIHCHNDLGMAVACSVAGAKAAVDAGVDAYVNTCVNGMGERAGNADLLSVILAVQKAASFSDRYRLDPRLDLSKSWRLAKYASYAFGVPIPINQVGVGQNAFAHASGIHADGVLKDRHNYELYDYGDLGLGEPEIVETGRQIVVGEYSGVRGFRNVYERLEIEFHSDEEARQILELVRYANVLKQKPLVTGELKFIARYPEQTRKLLTLTP
ncbi:MAG: homocitrate synthase [Lentisphaerae bacterium]|nr:homocitrate synthase [Lentisphaerota bacterium]MBT4817287.1 homocitrate synthase [Lentisphaerota bacterium]MBT5607720.1 homocitrate synthase [Lentisphaerota bacterium]MBT7054883.1 homocitrate synthase [Lentisphaerota bacterium]MBT7843347.1 homocitrate synthase [Lentisphaerota bacterium]